MSGRLPASDRPERGLWLVASLVAVLLLVDRIRILTVFSFDYTAQDQATLWYAAREFASLHFREPFFYGQTYLTTFEALLGAPLVLLRLSPHIALPFVTVALSTACWVLFSLSAWKRRAKWLSLLFASAFVLLVLEYSLFSSMPLGFVPGIFVAALSTYLVLNFRPSRLLFFLFGLSIAIAFSFNATSVLLTVPVGTYLWAANVRDPKFYFFSGAGLLLGLGLHLASLQFYVVNPAYNLHPSPGARIYPDLILRGLRHAGRYLAWTAPHLLKKSSLPLVVFAGLVISLAATRKFRYAAPAISGLIVSILLLGLPKSHEGSGSVYFPYPRFYLALPLLLSFLGLLLAEAWADSWVNRASRRYRGLSFIAYAILVVAVVVSFLSRQTGLHGEVADLVGRAQSGPVIIPQPTGQVLSDCNRMRELSDKHDVDLIVHIASPMRTYACGAILYGKVATLHPFYERRTWRLVEESTLMRDRVLISEVDPEICERPVAYVRTCEVVDYKFMMVLVTLEKRPAITLLKDLGLQVRRF